MPQTDKIGHGYEVEYRKLFSFQGNRFNHVRMLEIGVAQGEGLEWFRDLIREETGFTIWSMPGISINPHEEWCMAGVDYHPMAKVPEYAGLLMHHQELECLPKCVGEAFGSWPWTMIVDDASHHPDNTRATLENMWPLLDTGGFYVIEDWSHADMICGPLAQELPLAFGRNTTLPDVESITYRDGLIILEKKACSLTWS